MTYRNGRNGDYPGGGEHGRYRPEGRARARDYGRLERDEYYSGSQPPRRARDPGLEAGGRGGGHRHGSQPVMDGRDGRGARSFPPDGPEFFEYGSASGWQGSAGSMGAGPGGRRAVPYPASPRVSRDSRSHPQDAVGPPRSSPRLAGLAWVATGVGVLLDGLAVMLAWRGSALGTPLFWLAIIAPFLAFATILVRCRPSHATRQLTIALVGLYPAVIYRMSSPLVLGDFDEHLHERTLSDLLHGSGLFAPNPLLIVSPRYPGLELFTGVLIRLTGAPLIAGMTVAAFICRVLFVLALYHGGLAITRSYRRASLVVIFYAAAPQFYFFTSVFAYETLALTLAIGGLVLLYRALQDDFPGAKRPLVVLATVSLVATAAAHHATSWITLVVLAGWTATAPPRKRRTLAYVTGIVAIAVISWTALSISSIWSYVGPIFGGIVGQFQSTFGHVHLFKDAAGYALPSWERGIIVLYALLASGAAVTSGVILLRRIRGQRSYSLAVAALLSIAYPTTLASHFVPSTAFYGDRFSTFLALPVALCCALVIRNPISALRLRSDRARLYFVVLMSAATLAFVGGLIEGTGPDWRYLPGKYLVSADLHTQDSQTMAAVQWAAAHLPPGSRVVADRVPANLLSSQARLWPIWHASNGYGPETIYYSKVWDTSVVQAIKQLDIQYIYVDRRLSTQLPQVGYYILLGEKPKPTLISLAALTKFTSAPGLTAVYQHGPVAIYSTAGLGVRMVREGFTGNKSMGFAAPIQLLAGAIFGLLPFLFRRKWAFIARTLMDAGAAGSGVAVMALIILVGFPLFGLLLMPGPYFTLGAAEMFLPLVIVHLKRIGQRALPRPTLPAVHPLVLVGLLALIAGVALDLHSAWSVDVTAVHGILQSGTGGR